MATHSVNTNIAMTYDDVSNVYTTTYRYSYFDPNLVTGRVTKIGYRTDLRRFSGTGTSYSSMGNTSDVTYRFHYADGTYTNWRIGTYLNYVYYTDEITEDVELVEFQLRYYFTSPYRYRVYGWISNIESTVEGLDFLSASSPFVVNFMSAYKNMRGPMNYLILPRTSSSNDGLTKLEISSFNSTNYREIQTPYIFKTEDTSLTARYARATYAFIQTGEYFYVLLVPYVEPGLDPLIEERTIDSSVQPIKTNVSQSLEIIKQSNVQAIDSESATEVHKTSRSHVDPLMTEQVRHVLHVTSTKGNKISTIAFMKVKTMSSSLIEYVASRNSIQRDRIVEVGSGITSVSTKVSKEAVIHTESFIEPYGSSSVKSVAKETIVVSSKKAASSGACGKLITQSISSLQPITSTAEKAGYKDITIEFRLSRINSEANVIRECNRTSESHMEKLLSKPSTIIGSKPKSFMQNVSSSAMLRTADRAEQMEVLILSRILPIVSENHIVKKTGRTSEGHMENLLTHTAIHSIMQSKSFVTAMTTASSRQISRLPVKKTFTLISDTASIYSQNTMSREVILKSYTNKGFSKPLLSYQVDVASVISKITSGVAVQRDRIAFEISVDSHVELITYDILTERRQLKMRLNELKIRLRIPADDTANDDLLLVLLDDAIDFIQRTCNHEFGDLMPPTAKKVASQYVENELSMSRHIKAEWIADMKQEFESAKDRDKSLTDALRKAGLVRLRWGGR
ncbi:phage head-tail connector protein [Lederbergia citrisecunda]|uniref:phage head-tail connector protein n=1 Tax=Lederbergia citrisecunda TaxID=2833583 RepID=UPI003D26A167